jgi:hypothetical protein
VVFGRQGEAFIDVHANTDPYERELDSKIRQSSKDAEKLLDVIGEDWGEHLADGVSGELGRHGKDYGKAIEDATDRTTVRIKSKFTVDRHGRLHDAAGRFARAFEEEVEHEFERLTAPGGPFNRIGEGVADAVGAGFNISGRSPLISLLIPVFGAIAAVIGAAVQALGALVALLYTLPALLTAIGLQVGVLFIAFKGLGDRIKAAFEAKNAKELEKALFGLEEPAKRFVRSLLPLRDFWRDLQMVVRNNFFGALANPITEMLAALRGPALRGFAALATSMGTFFQSLADFFASPAFVKFINDVFPATTRWIERFGPALIGFLEALIAVAGAAMPFLERFGLLLANNLTFLADTLKRVTKDQSLSDWLDRMSETLTAVMDLLGTVIAFTATFLDELDKAGGKELITELAEALGRITFFLSTPVGQKAMEGLVNALVLSLQITGGLIIVLLALFAVVEFIGEAVGAFFGFLSDLIESGLEELGRLVSRIQEAITGLYTNLGTTFGRIKTSIMNAIDTALTFVQSLPGRALAALGDIKNALYNAGRGLVEGFINGIRSMIRPLQAAGEWIVNQVSRFLPGSPAEEGPLSGQGYTLYRGQRMVQDLVKGMRMEAPELKAASNDMVSNITFGKGAIQIGFNGAVPTEQEAQRTGSAVGDGINAILAPQRTRLAVRTL